MAERLQIPSNAIILIYAAHNGWLNIGSTEIALANIQNWALEHNIDLVSKDEPYLFQLIKKGYIEESEAILFGYAIKKAETRTAA